MTKLRSLMLALDGVAETSDLRMAGITSRRTLAAIEAGEILRVRRGWYALPDVHPDTLAAVRIGGRVACVSAAAHYGWATPESFDLHVCVAGNASRLRMPDDERRTIMHWSGDATPESRVVATMHETVLQLARCLDHEHTGAALDSLLHRRDVGRELLEGWLSELPDHVLHTLATRSELCESFLESIGRIRLERLGITGAHQVEVRGVGRVDLIIDGWLVIEWDGLEHHDSTGAHDEDCRRDAVLTSMGYRVLRFTYGLVLREWHLVIGAIRAALDGVSRR